MNTAEKIYPVVWQSDGFANNMLDSPVGLIDRGSMRSQRSELQATGHAAAVLFRLCRP